METEINLLARTHKCRRGLNLKESVGETGDAPIFPEWTEDILPSLPLLLSGVSCIDIVDFG